MNSLALSITLQAAFFLIVLLEILVPTGGLLFVASIGVFAASWWSIVQVESPLAIPAFVLTDLILLPPLVVFGLKMLRRSPMANREELSSESGYKVDVRIPLDLVGKTGLVVAQLRPSGKIDVEGVQYEALSNEGFLDRNTPIRVVRVGENKVFVESNKE